jgi:hypothetical protein
VSAGIARFGIRSIPGAGGPDLVSQFVENR